MMRDLEKLPNNSDSKYLYDEDLRNAIYYAINRDEMLNIVGWNSSYPVIYLNGIWSRFVIICVDAIDGNGNYNEFHIRNFYNTII
nr:hypothetical protein [Mycoplasmopsis bovis]